MSIFSDPLSLSRGTASSKTSWGWYLTAINIELSNHASQGRLQSLPVTLTTPQLRVPYDPMTFNWWEAAPMKFSSLSLIRGPHSAHLLIQGLRFSWGDEHNTRCNSDTADATWQPDVLPPTQNCWWQKCMALSNNNNTKTRHFWCRRKLYDHPRKNVLPQELWING
jgi:hypothetical protein